MEPPQQVSPEQEEGHSQSLHAQPFVLTGSSSLVRFEGTIFVVRPPTEPQHEAVVAPSLLDIAAATLVG